MWFDRHTNEKLAQTRIAEDQRLAATLRALERLEDRQAKPPGGSRWLSRLLRTLGNERIPNLDTL